MRALIVKSTETEYNKTKKVMTEEISTSNNPDGRPTLYRVEYNEQARRLALLGLTDGEMAEYFQVCEATIHNWKIQFPEFLESIRAGKVKADSDVALKLHDRAMGAEWEEQHPIKLKRKFYNSDGKPEEEERVEIVKVRKAAPPDTQAISLWLRNRKSDKWKEKADVTHTGMPTPITVTTQVLDALSMEQLEKIRTQAQEADGD